MTGASSRVRRRRTLLGTVAAALIAVIVAGAGPALVVRRDDGPPDFIVMLASHEWERLPATAALARRYPASQVLLTQPRAISAFNCFRCLDRPAWLAQEGIDPGRIGVLPWPVTNTHDEAQAVRRFLQSRPTARLLVVTSPYHTRRALATFSHVLAGTGTRVGIEPALAGSDVHPGPWWWAAHEDREYVAYEWTALAYYLVRFGVPPA